MMITTKKIILNAVTQEGSLSLCNNRYTAFKLCTRHVKRKYPINHELAKDLPVFQYPTSSNSDRRVYVWGLAEHGALGNQVQLKYKKQPQRYLQYPRRLHFAEQHKISNIACGYGFTAFSVNTSEEHKLFGCGINTDSQLGYQPSRGNRPMGLLLTPLPIELLLAKPSAMRVKQLAAGRAHLVVLTDGDGVFTLGNNAYGQCGRRVVTDEEYVGSRVVHHIPHMEGVSIASVECGQDHSLFVTERGEVYACGWGADGQTGQGHYKSEWRPSRVMGDITGENIVKVSGAADCILALNDKGEVFGWGNSEYNQLILSEDNQQLSISRHLTGCHGRGRIVDIAASLSSCIIVNEEGEVFVWGYGILGKGPALDHAAEPTHIPATLFGRNEFQPESRVQAVRAGLSHLAAITNTGDLYMWGRNRGGCLGLGHTKDQYFPFKVAVGARVTDVSCGADHTVALCRPFV